MSGSDSTRTPTAGVEVSGSLVACLTAVGWSPKMLARKINKMFGAGTVAESAPYYWVKSGGVPRPPVPTQVAHVLSQALGRTVTVAQLWQGRAADTGLLLPADVGLAAPWSHASGMALIEDWLHAGLTDRRSLLAVSGAPLVAIAQAHAAEPMRMSAALGGDHVDATLRAQVAALMPVLRKMDDRLGGTATMGYVSAQFLAVASLLHHGRSTVTGSPALLGLLAELGQLAGWVSEDGGRHGVAQRYYFTARYVAHLIGDTSLAAHVTGLMSYQAACRGHISDAIGLAEVALRLAQSAPALVRAVVAERAAHAYAVAGDVVQFNVTRDRAYEAFAGHDDAGDPRPSWSYYLNQAHLDSQFGLSEVAMGLALRRGNRSTSQRFLERGMVFLADAAGVDLHHPDQRRALFEGAWLAVAHAAVGDTRSAGTAADHALDRLGQVHSARSLAVLGVLQRELAPHERTPEVAAVLRRLTAVRAPAAT